MKRILGMSLILLSGCSTTSPEMERKIVEYQNLITTSKDILVFYNSKEVQEITVEDSSAASANKSGGILPAILLSSVDKVVEGRNRAKSNRYTIDFNEKLKSLQSKGSINVQFANAVLSKLSNKGYSAKLIDLDQENSQSYNNLKGLKIILNIKTGYLSPANSILLEPNRAISYEVMYDSNILSSGKIGEVGGWISDKYSTYETLAADAENARNILKKYLMDEVDNTVKQTLTIGKYNVKHP